MHFLNAFQFYGSRISQIHMFENLIFFYLKIVTIKKKEDLFQRNSFQAI